MSPPHSQSVVRISEELGIHVVTLYNWRKTWRLQGEVVPASEKEPEGWGAADKFSVVIETAGPPAISLGGQSSWASPQRACILIVTTSRAVKSLQATHLFLTSLGITVNRCCNTCWTGGRARTAGSESVTPRCVRTPTAAIRKATGCRRCQGYRGAQPVAPQRVLFHR
jgi:hypothetical protein